MRDEEFVLNELLNHGRVKTFSENYLSAFLELEKLKSESVIEDRQIEKSEQSLWCLNQLNHTWKLNLNYLFDPFFWDTKMLVTLEKGKMTQRFPKTRLVMFFTSKGNLSFRWRPVELRENSDFKASAHFIEHRAKFIGSISERPVNELLFLRGEEFARHFFNNERLIFNIHLTNCLIALCSDIEFFLSQYFSAENENEIRFVKKDGIVSGWNIYKKLDRD